MGAGGDKRTEGGALGFPIMEGGKLVAFVGTKQTLVNVS